MPAACPVKRCVAFGAGAGAGAAGAAGAAVVGGDVVADVADADAGAVVGGDVGVLTMMQTPDGRCEAQACSAQQQQRRKQLWCWRP